MRILPPPKAWECRASNTRVLMAVGVTPKHIITFEYSGTIPSPLRRPAPRYKQIKIVPVHAPLTTDPDAAKRASLDELADGLWRKPKLAGCLADTQEINPTLNNLGPDHLHDALQVRFSVGHRVSAY